MRAEQGVLLGRPFTIRQGPQQLAPMLTTPSTASGRRLL